MGAVANTTSSRQWRPSSQGKLTLGLTILVLFTGCAVGPDFKVPSPPEVQNLTPQPLDGKVQRFVSANDISGEWWKVFHWNELNTIIERGLRENHDLKAAQAALHAARANYQAQTGAFFPTIAVNETSSRQKVETANLTVPTLSGDPYFTLHTAQLAISYVPDVFGGVRRQVEAASAQAEAQRFMLEATYLTLTSNIALAAIQEASLRQQIEITKRTIDHETLLARGGDVSAESFKSATARDWAALDASIAQTKQTVPLLQKQLAAQRDLLAALAGGFAGAGLPERFTMDSLRLPRDLPVMLPSRIVEQRPDVRAARANFHAAGALVGVAIANRLPLFNLTGSIGRTGSQLSNLSSPAPQFLFWNAAGSVTQTVFDGFTLEQRQRAAEAGWHEAAEQYRSTVVTAFQNVADVLQAIEFDRRSLTSAAAAETAGKQNLCLTVAAFFGYDGKEKPEESDLTGISKDANSRFRKEITRDFATWWSNRCAGLPPELNLKKDLANPGEPPSGIDVVASEQLYLSTELSFVVAKATQYADVVALFQALGGGWWNRTDAEPPDVRGFFASPRSP
jgi:NodT family efflux transporter outer membrane factor (OMF) lipoprotein